MLYPNGQRVLCYPGRHMSGLLAASGTLAYGGLLGARLNRYVSDTYSKVLGAVPSGYSGNAYVLAIKSGGIAGFSGLSVTGTAAGVLGLPGSGDASITLTAANGQIYPLDDTSQIRSGIASISFTVADATGQLISSGSGAASLTFTVADALLVASLAGSGSAEFSISTNTPLLGALASMNADGSFSLTANNSQVLPLDTTSPVRSGTANFAITGSLIPYAIGTMSGSTADNSVLTVDAIAAGVLAAALTSPIAANIKRVNDYQVNGNGQAGTEWGP